MAAQLTGDIGELADARDYWLKQAREWSQIAQQYPASSYDRRSAESSMHTSREMAAKYAAAIEERENNQ